MRGREHRPAILLPVLVCVVLGVACAYASSIVCVLLPDRGQNAPRVSSRHDLPGDQTIRVTTIRRPGYFLMTVSSPMPTRVADVLNETASWQMPTRTGDPRPSWLKRSAIENRQHTRGVAAGWPFLCTWGRTDVNTSRRPKDVHTGVHYTTVRGARHAFPLLPLVPGLLANVLIYGLTTIGLWYSAVWLHRRWRWRRGRCPHCAYPVDRERGLCPECGYAFAPTAAGSKMGSGVSSASSAQTTSTLTSKSSSSEDK